MNKYIKTINQKEITIRKNKVNYPFITSILEYFKFDINKIYFNESSSKDPNKQSIDDNKSDIYENAYTYKETFSHYNFTK